LDMAVNPIEDLVRGGVISKAQVVLPVKSQFNYDGAAFGAGGIEKVTQ